MGCGCGQKTRPAPRPSASGAARPAPAPRPSPAAALAAPRPAAVAPPGSSPAALIIRYLGEVPITVRGVSTGALYRFVSRGQVASVDRRDTGALLATRQFVSV
jgi:hypothetical protein